jgi:predicted nucleic acid-binding Zn ribbon protein
MSQLQRRLKIEADQPDQRPSLAESEGAVESSQVAEKSNEIPIFCAGGCGEVMGYARTGDCIPTRWCPVCESANAEPAIERVPSTTDELAELRSPSRRLRTVHFIQVLAVCLIFAGSVYIALGRPIGIYLAAVGTLAWAAVGLVLWRLKS